MESATALAEATELVTEFVRRNQRFLVVEVGNLPPPGALLAKVTLLDRQEKPHAIYWFWRQCLTDSWECVSPNHPSVMAARTKPWTRLDRVSALLGQAVLSRLPVEVLQEV